MGYVLIFLLFGVPAILYFAGQVIEWHVQRMANKPPEKQRVDPGKIAKLERQLLDD